MKSFNVTGECNPRFHYMVDINQNLHEIKLMVDKGNYFTINRARQYGKTTTLSALDRYLKDTYVVIHLDFQLLSYKEFSTEALFVSAFVKALLWEVAGKDFVPTEIKERLMEFTDSSNPITSLSEMFRCLSEWCAQSAKPIVLMIDEVDSAANNQVFVDFLAQLRGYYLKRTRNGTPAFQSVILAGVHDIKHLKRKIKLATEEADGPDGHNSPWNIATDFLVDMSFDQNGIAGMLREYENDHHTGMDVEEIAGLIYEYTSGYPYLVSRICNIIDERVQRNKSYVKYELAWTKTGFLEAMKILLFEKNSLFESLINKLNDYPELSRMLYELLFSGREIMYTVGSRAIEEAEMFGFIKEVNGSVSISNRIFEIVLYNLFLTEPEVQKSDIYKAALGDKNQFIENGRLNMRLVLEKFIQQFTMLYGEHPRKFYEEEGRKYFLMFLRPIINGTGNYYIEPQTRTATRSDVIVDYRGEQFVIELKIWGGPAYHTKGEQQLAEYLAFHNLKTGYMLTFNFNQKKEIGIKEVAYGDKILIEAVV